MFIQNEWADRLQCLQRGGGVWGGFSEEGKWALDFTEGASLRLSSAIEAGKETDHARLLGYCRMRKKLQRVEAPHSAAESGRTRTLATTDGTTSAGTHQSTYPRCSFTRPNAHLPPPSSCRRRCPLPFIEPRHAARGDDLDRGS